MQATRQAVQALAALHVGEFAIGAADGDVKGELFTRYLRWDAGQQLGVSGKNWTCAYAFVGT